MQYLLLIVIIFSLNPVQAELYKSLDENGEVIYSDKPPTKDAKEFKPPALMVTPPIKYVPKKKPVEQQAAAYNYSDIRFTQPEADAGFHDNEGKISYVLSVTPALSTRLGHYLNIKLDGAVVASQTSALSGDLKDVERGSHNLSADICDANGKVLRSAGVSFHVHKFSSLRQPAPPPPPAP